MNALCMTFIKICWLWFLVNDINGFSHISSADMIKGANAVMQNLNQPVFWRLTVVKALLCYWTVKDFITPSSLSPTKLNLIIMAGIQRPLPDFTEGLSFIVSCRCAVNTVSPRLHDLRNRLCGLAFIRVHYTRKAFFSYDLLRWRTMEVFSVFFLFFYQSPQRNVMPSMSH